jgi:iron(III) transport system permease protein
LARAQIAFPHVRIGGARVSRPRAPFLLVLAGVLVGAAVLLPVAYLIVRTLGAGEETASVLFRARSAAIILRSLVLVAVVTTGTVALAVPLAWLTTRTDLPLGRFWAVAVALPLVIPSYVAAMVAVAALGPRGMVQGLLEVVAGVDRIPDIYGLPGAAIVLILLSYPYVYIPVRASLRRMDPALEEAARSLGYGQARTLFRVTVPLLRPAITAGALLVALYALSDFGAVSLMGYETFTWAIFVQYGTAFDRTAASALSLVLIFIAVAILFVDTVSQSRGRYYRSTVGTVRPPRIVRLGSWRWASFSLVALLVAIVVAAPLFVLLYWIVKGAAGSGLSFPAAAAWNSIRVAGMAAGVTTAAALPIAILAVRFRSRATIFLDRASHMGFALPGIVIALALVFFGVNFATPVYQTTALLVFAYGILFLPAASGAIKSSLMQVNPHIEEAARALGRTDWRVLLQVTLPLVMPGMLAGAAMVFLLTMKELPATLILGPLGFKTLATDVWSAASEAFFARAAVPAIMLVVAAGAPAAYLLLRDTSRHTQRHAAGQPAGSPGSQMDEED